MPLPPNMAVDQYHPVHAFVMPEVSRIPLATRGVGTLPRYTIGVFYLLTYFPLLIYKGAELVPLPPKIPS